MSNKGQIYKKGQSPVIRDKSAPDSDFVLEKSIFTNVFGKDIRRVFIYKKTERLAKAIHLITPAFMGSASLRNRIDGIAVGLVDAAILQPSYARDALSKELLALSSILGIARSGGLLSSMNADLIIHEAHLLLQEVAAYEEPRLFLDESQSLAGLLKKSEKTSDTTRPKQQRVSIGHVKDNNDSSSRTDSILAVIRSKGTVYIKDISTVVRDVSEKTIQRELQKLVQSGIIVKKGDRRWTAYSIKE